MKPNMQTYRLMLAAADTVYALEDFYHRIRRSKDLREKYFTPEAVKALAAVENLTGQIATDAKAALATVPVAEWTKEKKTDEVQQ